MKDYIEIMAGDGDTTIKLEILKHDRRGLKIHPTIGISIDGSEPMFFDKDIIDTAREFGLKHSIEI